ncbi:L-asparaginase 1 [Zobellella endophytica]|uniref:asparaginase n=1 Tax=Zobellella endophytica TaxID=2116700 RepID=A0A2P7R907_9GAMM|nr:type I asparaginase [Zobellella endophytica]PSJ46662.1 L-asparaginase 1 [Zobellella endophytica]
MGRVLILHTGGTIGCRATSEGHKPSLDFTALLRKRLADSGEPELPGFDVIELQTLIDSANLTPAHWAQIAGLLVVHWQDYDGFLVLHGTDTMAYTASALSFMLQGQDKPVIITGSQIPLSERRSDGLDNLINGLHLCVAPGLAEVCIYFNGRLLRGNRTTKLKATELDAFASPNLPPLGVAGIRLEPDRGLLLPAGPLCFRIPEFDPEAVTVLSLYPGISARAARALLEHAPLRGVVMLSFGVGNPPDANTELMAALAAAVERGIVIVNRTHCLYGKVDQGTYATGNSLNRIGVTPGGDLTLEAAFAKLHYLLAMEQDPARVRELMCRPLRGEMMAV